MYVIVCNKLFSFSFSYFHFIFIQRTPSLCMSSQFISASTVAATPSLPTTISLISSKFTLSPPLTPSTVAEAESAANAVSSAAVVDSDASPSHHFQSSWLHLHMSCSRPLSPLAHTDTEQPWKRPRRLPQPLKHLLTFPAPTHALYSLFIETFFMQAKTKLFHLFQKRKSPVLAHVLLSAL